MFPFNQPDKTRDCGYRCLYYILGIEEPYQVWLDNFRFFNPVKSGIHFTDICDVLDFHKVDYKFTQVTDNGLYLIYSGIWLHPEGKKHGHYFIYDHGTVYCTTRQNPYPMALNAIVARLEGKSVEHAFRVMEIL